MHKMSGLNLAWQWQGGCETCAFEELVWDCLFWWFVIKIACIGQCEETGVFVGLYCLGDEMYHFVVLCNS